MTPTALVDLDALISNYDSLRRKAGRAEVGGVVKADAYGLGLIPVGEALYAAGCRTFFVTYLSEALALRPHVPAATIIALNGIQEQDYAEAVVHGITPALNYLGAIETWRRFAHAHEKKVPALIHLDTGMNRLGLSPGEQATLIERQDLLDGLTIQAWASHFACADEFDNPMTTEQRDRFKDVLRLLPSAPVSLCNSSGLFWGEGYTFDLVRPGLALYGGNPTPQEPNPMRGVVEIHAPVLQVRDIDQGMPIGYGASYRARHGGRIAALGLGYADGYLRTLGNRGHVTIGGYEAPLVGRISMDLLTVDVTDIPDDVAHVGAVATIIGPHRTIDQVAAEAGTIPYEILTNLGNRVVRTYSNVKATTDRQLSSASGEAA